jgi:hypothetical protein
MFNKTAVPRLGSVVVLPYQIDITSYSSFLHNNIITPSAAGADVTKDLYFLFLREKNKSRFSLMGETHKSVPSRLEVAGQMLPREGYSCDGR